MLTLDNLSVASQYANTCNTFDALFSYDIVPVVNENDTVAVEELRSFGDNDKTTPVPPPAPPPPPPPPLAYPQTREPPNRTSAAKTPRPGWLQAVPRLVELSWLPVPELSSQ
jgi:hypothetical protein